MIGYATQQDLADAVGVSPSTLVNWITAGIIPAPDKQVRGGKKSYYDMKTFDRLVKWLLERERYSRMKFGE